MIRSTVTYVVAWLFVVAELKVWNHLPADIKLRASSFVACELRSSTYG